MTMKYLKPATLIILALLLVQAAPAPKGEFFEIKVYTITSTDQEKVIDEYLEKAYLPALHRAGIKTIGVFKPIETDTVYFGKRIFVLTPFKSLDQFSALEGILQKDNAYLTAGKNYIDAVYTHPPYARIETILLKAFKDMPVLEVPKLNSPAHERVYELRSYEGHTEKIYKNKVHMFNEGGEVLLFKKLEFNAVFYGDVIAGSRMPNLMYMTTFANRAAREAHWNSFRDAPEWKKLSSMPEYQHNVSRSDIYLLRPTGYSDI
jgi:hypothetical protein